MLCVMTWNLDFGGQFAMPVNQRLHAIEKVIQGQKRLDIVAVQEAPNFRAFQPWVRNNLGMDLRFGARRRGSHVASVFREHVPGVAVDTLPYTWAARPMIKVELPSDRGRVGIYNVHLSARSTIRAIERRERQVRAVLEKVLVAGTPGHLLVGDFNFHDEKEPGYLALRDHGYSDCYCSARTKCGPDYTYHGHSQPYRADYIFASPTFPLKAVSYSVLTGHDVEQASDHFPVVAEFE